MQIEAAKRLLAALDKAYARFPQHAQLPAIVINIDKQRLYVVAARQVVCEYPVSTSRFGVGQNEGSYHTPTGLHCVQEKIGAHAAAGEIFETRVRTNKFALIENDKADIQKDCITSRILWLAGLEDGINKGANVDSHARYIYIHGTNAEGHIGQPASEGCIRMKNNDVIDLFDRVDISSLVIIFTTRQ